MTDRPAWPLLLALATGAFAIGTAEFSGMSMLPFYAADLQVDQPTAAHAVSLYALGVVVGAPVLSIATARLSRIPAAALLIGAVAIGNLATALGHGYATMLLTRFLSGLPHGAFFGQAALIAAATLPRRRAQAVAFAMTGLTVATVIGAPLGNLLGQTIGWRWGFAMAAGTAIASAVALALAARRRHVAASVGDWRAEIGDLARLQPWLTLATGAIGFGGLFAVYAFLPAIVTSTTGLSDTVTPWILSLFGVGMLVGNIAAGWAADRAQTATAAIILIGGGVALALLPLAAPATATLLPTIFVIAMIGGLGPVLQIRLMDVAGEAQTLAAALHHAAFNVANAIGPWIAGVAIVRTGTWIAAGPVGAMLSLGGLLILMAATVLRHGSDPSNQDQ